MSVLLTIDDFDPIISYSNYDDWQTPDPSLNPSWYNATPDVTGSPWHEATYHTTTVVNASASFNVTGTSLAIYGAGGPSGTSYRVTIDPSLASPFSQVFNTGNATGNGRTLLFQTSDLAFAPHEVTIQNLGSGLTLDLVEVQVPLGADGATLANTTVGSASSQITYVGDWSRQNFSYFYEGTNVYTQGPNNAFSFAFQGSAFYLYGDAVDDHGFFSVYFNSSTRPWESSPVPTPNATLNARSGCGGTYRKACEKLGVLKYFAGPLPQGNHTVTVVNDGPPLGQNATFFDFDYFVYTTPSSYLSQSPASSSCPFTSCNSTSGGTPSSSSGPSGASAAPSASRTGAASTNSIGSLSLLAVLGAWALRRFLHP